MEVTERLVTIAIEVQREERMPSHEKVPDLLMRWGLGKQIQECFWVIAYDSMMNIRTVVEVARGAYARVNVHYPAIYAAVLQVGCERFQVAHNHPAGSPKPTSHDITLTKQIMDGANACGLFFEDHVIVTPTGKSYSFTERHLMLPARFTGELTA